MKKKLIALMLLCATLPLAAQTYWDGTADKNLPGEGTESSPYLISTPEQLAGLAARVNDDEETFEGKFVKLTQDIYLTDFSQAEADRMQWTPIGGVFYGNYTTDPETGETIAPKVTEKSFCGHFDGGGHTIHNLYYGQGDDWGKDFDPNDFDIAGWGSSLTDLDFSTWNKALFGLVSGGSISNLVIADAQMKGICNVALLVNYVRKGSVISNCHVGGSISSVSALGGMVNSNAGVIENCTADITANGKSSMYNRGLIFGGIASINTATGIIRQCSVIGSADQGAGVSYQNIGLIEQTTSAVDFTCLYGRTAPNDAAGFVEFNNKGGVIRECVATGNLYGVGYLSGFCYENQGHIESSYATGDLFNKPIEGVTSHANMSLFVYNNGDPSQSNVNGGTCINCFGTGTCHVADDDSNVNNAYGFVADYHGSPVTLESMSYSRQANCYWNKNGLTQGSTKNAFRWAGTDLTVAEMQSQAFVDELNKMAALCGTSTWEYRAGQFPKATGVKATNIAEYMGGGDGTKGNPYLISSKEQLENFQWFVNRGYDFHGEYILQTADIALNAPFEQWGEQAPTKWTPIGNHLTNSHFDGELIHQFRGHYDGLFHEVQNMYIDNTSAGQGFFGNIGDGSTIRNLGITDVYMKADKGAIVAGCLLNYNTTVTISQCWTSGSLKYKGSDATLSALVIRSENSAPVHILNCQSSASVEALNAAAVDPTYDSDVTRKQCVLGNMLFTGNLAAYNKMVPQSSDYHLQTNAWYDNTVMYIEYVTGDGQQPTAYLQSREAVNELNAFVTKWNKTHTGDETLNYWLWREGQYPVVSTDASYEPAVTITFHNNGGTEVDAFKVEPNSKIVPPVRPKRDGYFFVAWCTDEALSKPCTFETPFTESTTLYAKWIENTTADYDLSLFDNEFASTFKIKTKQQLRGFAMAVNGVYDFSQVLQNSDAQPTTIRTPMDFTGKTITLENDILLNDTTDWQLWGKNVYAEPWLPIGTDLSDKYGFSSHPFTGTFDGKGHTISGLYVEMNTVPSAMSGTWGLFGELGSGSVVKNLGITASVINGQSYDDGTFRPAGYDKQHLSLPGLLAGKADNAIINQCFAQGKIIVAENNYTRYTGGMIANVTGLNTAITDCYAIVDIDGDDTYYCGLIGNNDGGTIANCYSAGSTYWGLAGGNSSYGSTTHSYYNQDLVSQPYQYPYHVYGGTGKTTVEMKQKATYEGWDFNTVWGISSTINDGYPFLRQFYPDYKEDVVLTTAPTAVSDLAYTGEPLVLITAGVAEGGEVQYALGAEGEYSTALPTATDAGDYEVYYRVVPDEAHGGGLPVAGPIGITIARAAGSISFEVASVSKTFGDAPFTNQLTLTGDGTVVYASDNEAVATVDAATGEVIIIGVGTATITATVVEKDGGNYAYATTTASFIVGVNTAAMTVTANNYTGTYDGEPHGISVTVSEPEGAVVKYGTAEGIYDLDESPAYTNAGSYTVYYQVTKRGYATVENSAVISIRKAVGSIAYAVTTVNKLDTDGPFTNELTLTGDGMVIYASDNADVATVDAATGEVTITGAGEAMITATVTDGTNYEYATKTARYTLTVTVDPASGIHSVGIEEDAKNTKWYDMNGRKLSGKPTKKGIYMKQGQKVIVK